MMESRWMNRASFSIPGVACYHAHLSVELSYDCLWSPPASDCGGGGCLYDEAVGAFSDVYLVDFADAYELLDSELTDAFRSGFIR